MKPQEGFLYLMNMTYRSGFCPILIFLLLAHGPLQGATLSEEGAEGVIPAGYASGSGKGISTQSGDFRIVPYGTFWADMLYATQRTNPGAFTFFVFSEEAQGEDAFAVDARRSRFGLNLTGPEIPVDGGMQMGGNVEIDLQGDFVIENRAEVLLRHAYWEAKNERQRWLVGQYWDVISPLNPRTLNYSVGWLGGNVGFRRAQFRYERFGSLSDNMAWKLQTSLGQDIVPDLRTEPGVVRESSNWPVVQARAAIALDQGGETRGTTLGVSGHIGETGFDFNTVGPAPLSLPPQDDARFESWSYNVDLSVPVTKRLSIQAEFFQGKNLSPFLGGIGQGICPCNRHTVSSLGGWADMQLVWSDCLSTSVGFGIDDPKDTDFLVGRTYNQFIFANFLVTLTEALSTGFEVTYWKTLYQDTRVGQIPAEDLGPRAPGEAVVLNWMMKYSF